MSKAKSFQDVWRELGEQFLPFADAGHERAAARAAASACPCSRSRSAWPPCSSSGPSIGS